MSSLRNITGVMALVSIFTAVNGYADELDVMDQQVGMINADSLLAVGSARNTLPLVSISLGASSQSVNSYSVDVTAVVNTWTLKDRYEPVFSSHRIDFSVQPGQLETLSSHSMKIKDSVSPQSLLDKMLKDGALTLNVVW